MMIKTCILFALAVVLAAPISLSSQIFSRALTGAHPNDDHRLCSHGHARHGLAAEDRPSAIVLRPYDALSYDLDIDWVGVLSREEATGEARHFSARNTMRLEVRDIAMTAIEIDAESITIDSVILDGERLALTPQPVDGVVAVPVPGVPLELGQIMTLDIFYTHISQEYEGHIDPDNRGFYLYEKGHRNGADETAERLAYTLGAPTDARFWMPCNDVPNDKAVVSYRVRVPEEFTVACNGLLDSVVVEDNDVRSFYWSDTTQVSTYLLAAVASKYTQYSDWYTRLSDPNDSVEVRYFVWEEDLDDSQGKYDARTAFTNTVAMMEHFSALLGEYPFQAYGMTVSQPFVYTAMENQTMVTLDRRVLNDNEPTIAHELMHQWIGNLVSPATWNDIWMNEGGATYGEALWAEFGDGSAGYAEMMDEKRTAYIRSNSSGNNQPPCYREMEFPIDTRFLYNYAVTYAKGSWIYHMLRRTLGDVDFFLAMRSFLDRFAFRAAETEDLIASLEQDIEEGIIHQPQIDIRQFFEQWVYGQGHPRYTIASDVSRAAEGEYTVRATLSQTQTTQDVFAMPVSLVFYGAEDQRQEVFFFNDQREQTEVFTLPFVPANVVFDENESILCTKTSTITHVRETAPIAQDSYSISPNPTSAGDSAVITFATQSQAHIRIEIVDIMGNLVNRIHDGILPAGSFTAEWQTERIAAGTYAVRILADDAIVYSGAITVVR